MVFVHDNKKLERQYLQEIKEIYNEFPIGVVTDSDPLDFIILSESNTIGLEITRFIRKQSDFEPNQREVAAIQRTILKSAERIYINKNNKINLFVTTSWRFNKRLKKNEIDLLADELANLVLNNIPDKLLTPVHLDYLDLYNYKLKDYCHSLTILRVNKKTDFVYSEGSFITVSKSEIENRIKSKALKIPSYRAKCNEVWLCIVCESIDISSMVDLEYVTQEKFESPFDRLLIYDRENRYVYDLVNTKTD